MPQDTAFGQTFVPYGVHRLAVYRNGAAKRALMCLNGGPGLPSLYLRAPHAHLANDDLSVLAYDQLGTGLSDKPGDPSLWQVARYCAEVEAVREQLGLERWILLGHSWGVMLALEYALAYPNRVEGLILADGVASVPFLVQELNGLRAALGPETVMMMGRHEAEGTLDHPEYQAAITLLNYRHVCRVQDWPETLTASLNAWNMDIYGTMQGPNEFTFTGNYKGWSRLDDLHRVMQPSLVICGEHDELTPACSGQLHRGLPNSRLCVVPGASHMPFYERPDVYFPVVEDFLDRLSEQSA